MHPSNARHVIKFQNIFIAIACQYMTLYQISCAVFISHVGKELFAISTYVEIHFISEKIEVQ